MRDTSPSRRWTFRDYLLIPQDGKRHQIVRGERSVTPAPTPRHQIVTLRLAHAILDFVEPRGLGEVLISPIDMVLASHVPTAHAEVTAIRDAARSRGRHHLTGCGLFTSCEPCPMCLAAAYWAQIERIRCASTRADAARIGFQDEDLYGELTAPLERFTFSR